MKATLFTLFLFASILVQSQSIIHATKKQDEKSSKYGLKIDGKNRWLIPPIYDDILAPDRYNSNYGGIRLIVQKDGKYGVGTFSNLQDPIPLIYKKIEKQGKDYNDLLFCQLQDNRWDIHFDGKIYSVDELELIFNSTAGNNFTDAKIDKVYQIKNGHKLSFCMIAGKAYIDTTSYDQIQVMKGRYVIGKTNENFRIFDGYAFSLRTIFSTSQVYDTYSDVIVSDHALLVQNSKDKKWTFRNELRGPANSPISFPDAFTYKNHLLLSNGKDTFKVVHPHSKAYDLEFTSLRFFNEHLTPLDYGKWIVRTKNNKYGIYDTTTNKMVFDTVNNIIYPWAYSSAYVIIKRPGEAFLYNTFTNAVNENLSLSDITQLVPHKDEAPLFGKTSNNKWIYFSPVEFEFDTTRLYDEIKDGKSPEIYFTRQGNTWFASGKYGTRDAQTLSLKKDETPISYYFGMSALIYSEKGSGKIGLKSANGQQLIHAGCEDITYKNNAISFIIDGHKTTLQLSPGKLITIDPNNLITLHPDECTYCSFGSISRKTVIPEKVKTITQGTSVQTLQSEKFDTKSGTWIKTYGSAKSSRDVTLSQGSVTTELIDCPVCKGTGQSGGIYKWNGSKYLLYKTNQ